MYCNIMSDLYIHMVVCHAAIYYFTHDWEKKVADSAIKKVPGKMYKMLNDV